MQTRTKLILGGAAFVVASTALVAVGSAGGWRHGGGMGGMGGPGHGPMRLMEQLDTNGDGKLTKEEVDGVSQAKLAQFDTDKNGGLTLQEFQGLWLDFMRPQMVRGFQRFDADGDGSVTKAELEAPLDRMLQHMDANDDGAIGRDEMGPRHHRRGDRDRGPDGPEGPDGPDSE